MKFLPTSAILRLYDSVTVTSQVILLTVLFFVKILLRFLLLRLMGSKLSFGTLWNIVYLEMATFGIFNLVGAIITDVA